MTEMCRYAGGEGSGDDLEEILHPYEDRSMTVVRYVQQERVAVLTLCNPPVNALSVATRTGLLDGVNRALASDAAAILIVAEGSTFSAGADINEFGQPPVEPSLGDLFRHIEDCPLPVVVAIQGAALGGGFELALAAHYRIAARNARIGLPEVKLGLLPGAGGTQRLPRLSGANAALEVILSGEPIAAEAALQMGMLDDVVDGDLAEAGLIWADQIADGGLGPRPTRKVTTGMSDPVTFMADIAAWHAALEGETADTTGKIIECVEASLLLPFEAGLLRERSVFRELLASDRSRGLRHAFRAERSAGRSAKQVSGKPRYIQSCVVMGGGFLGGSISMALLNSGLKTTLIETDDASLSEAVGSILDVYDRSVSRGDLAASERDARMALLSGSSAYTSAAGADVIIHAGPVAADQAGRDLAGFAKAAGGQPILAVASDLDISVLVETIGRDALVGQMVFHPPLRANPLVEVLVPEGAAPELAASLFALARRMGLKPLLVAPRGSGEGLIAGRLRGAMRQVAEHLLILGAAPEAIDAAVRDWGFRLGPFEAEDRAGLEAGRADQSRSYPDRNPQIIGQPMTSALLDAGRTGRSAGAGWFSYDTEDGRARPDPVVRDILSATRPGTTAAPGDAQIQLWTQAAIANSGAWLVADKVVDHPIDVDMAALSGLGMARARGGPMLSADLAGLAQLQQALAAMNAEHPGAWTPSPLWSELIKNGRSFSDLNE